ncbi:MAG: DUF3500 domain-containing protein [Polyangiales bacterium]
MRHHAWLLVLAYATACGDDDGGSTDTMDAGTLDSGTGVGDGGLSSDAAVACSSEATQQGRVACAANAMLATLTDTQKAGVAFALTDYATRSKWSNFPVQMNARAGMQMSALSSSSQAAVLDLLRIALNTNGQNTAIGILRADDYLASRANGYGSGLYSVAVFGTPAATGDFEVMFGGHHMAYNLNFVGGNLYPVPQHLGAEPKGSFTLNGASYDPLTAKGDAMFAIYSGLDTAQRTTAYLSGQTFNDTIAAPSLDYNKGASRTSKTVYPTGDNRKGVKVSDLSTTQQALVTTAIEQWARQYPNELSDALMTAYTGAYADTLFAWAGSSSGPSKDAQNSYLRIDGPRVWIELAVQGGIVIQGETHYHTIYRDKTMDYGGQF